MLARTVSTLLVVATLACTVVAQIVDVRWVNPPGAQPDFTYTPNIGDLFTVSWKTLNNSKSDLYLLPWDSVKSSFSRRLAASLDISQPGTFDWKIDVAGPALSTGNQFKLAFWPAGKPYGGIDTRIILSPGFVIPGSPPPDYTTSSSASSTSSTSSTPVTSLTTTMTTATTTSSVTTTTPTSTSTNHSTGSSSSNISSSTFTSAANIPASTSNSGSSSSTAEPPQEGLSVAAKAGLGIGISIGAIALLAAAYVLGRRHRRLPRPLNNTNYYSVNSTSHFWSPRHEPLPSRDGYSDHAISTPVPRYSSPQDRVEVEGDKYFARELAPDRIELAGTMPKR